MHRKISRKVKYAMLIFALLVPVVFIACSAPEPTPTSAPRPTATPIPQDTRTVWEKALAGEYSGTQVTMFGPVRGAEELRLNAAFATFENITGIDVQYNGTSSFETDIITRVNAGSPPDVVDFPQPGLLANFVRQGEIVEITSFLDKSYLEETYTPAWVEASTLTGPDGRDFVAGVWHRTNGKSQVFYNKPAFETAGYQVPDTFEELIALGEQIKRDGGTPWCFGIESGVATGWAATDWTENLLLNFSGPTVYDQWVAGEVRFNSPEVREAINAWSELLLTPGNSFGGREYIVATQFGDAAGPLFDNPPGCYMFRQGNFVTGNAPFDTQEPGVDYDAFLFPGPASGGFNGFIIGGDLFAAFSDRPEVQAVIQFITTPASIQPFLIDGGVIAPHRAAKDEWYGSPIDARIGKLIAEAEAVRFDGSDLQPGEVGAGTFWTEITAYIANTQDLDTTLTNIDNSWPGR